MFFLSYSNLLIDKSLRSVSPGMMVTIEQEGLTAGTNLSNYFWVITYPQLVARYLHLPEGTQKQVVSSWDQAICQPFYSVSCKSEQRLEDIR